MRTLLSLTLLALFSTACGSLAFDVAQDLPEQRVAGSPLGGILPGFIAVPIPLTVNLRAETEKRNTGPARSAHLKSLSLRATPADRPSGNFDFLEEVHIYIEAQDGSLPRRAIARLSPVPRGQTTVQFTVLPEVDLLPYINAGAAITASARGSQPRQDFTYDGRVEITVRI